MKNTITILDGAMGTMLQQCGLKMGEKPEVFGMQNPEAVKNIHLRYIEAGSDVIYANTFGVNAKKYAGCEYSVREVIAANIAIAKDAVNDVFTEMDPHKTRVALDIGPIGELMEPLGTLSFEEAYDIFREVVTAGADAGADLIVIETMTDLSEVKAAVLAAKENTSLPVWTTMSFEKSGRTFAGVTPSAMALTLTGLGVDALGVNCSLGPSDLIPIIEEMMQFTHLPIIVKPNAGLPDPKSGLYAMSPEQFARQMEVFPQMGVTILGGCCGTKPSYIGALSAAGYTAERNTRRSYDISDTAEQNPIVQNASNQNTASQSSANQNVSKQNVPKKDVLQKKTQKNGICSASRTTLLDGNVRIIGERINPTGKKRFQQALREHDMNYVQRCAIDQAQAGADLLDINVGLPNADEKTLMHDVVCAVQAVCDLPLQIDSGNPEVIEAGLRAAVGRSIVNSVNADEETCRKILPIVRKYGAMVVGLSLDKSGMPKNAAERISHVKKILIMTDEAGIPRQDVIIDCLALTISAQQDQAMETLKALSFVKKEFGVHCTLGVSNISFGLPERETITASFLTQAMYCGLDLPIINPNQTAIMDAVASFRALSCQDPSCMDYITRFAGRADLNIAVTNTSVHTKGKVSSCASSLSSIQEAVLLGLPQEVKNCTFALLKAKSPMEIIEQDLIPALDEVGRRYEKKTLFLPQLINAANAASSGFELIREKLSGDGTDSISKGKILLATVEGDIHDIGKNIVKVVLENYGFHVIDLGKDVSAERVVEAAKKEDPGMIGLSALMTTTLPSMEKTIRAVRSAGITCPFMVGGAVVTEQYTKEIGADYYAEDAKAAADIARKVFS